MKNICRDISHFHSITIQM